MMNLAIRHKSIYQNRVSIRNAALVYVKFNAIRFRTLEFVYVPPNPRWPSKSRNFALFLENNSILTKCSLTAFSVTSVMFYVHI